MTPREITRTALVFMQQAVLGQPVPEENWNRLLSEVFRVDLGLPCLLRLLFTSLALYPVSISVVVDHSLHRLPDDHDRESLALLFAKLLFEGDAEFASALAFECGFGGDMSLQQFKTLNTPLLRELLLVPATRLSIIHGVCSVWRTSESSSYKSLLAVAAGGDGHELFAPVLHHVLYGRLERMMCLNDYELMEVLIPLYFVSIIGGKISSDVIQLAPLDLDYTQVAGINAVVAMLMLGKECLTVATSIASNKANGLSLYDRMVDHLYQIPWLRLFSIIRSNPEAGASLLNGKLKYLLSCFYPSILLLLSEFIEDNRLFDGMSLKNDEDLARIHHILRRSDIDQKIIPPFADLTVNPRLLTANFRVGLLKFMKRLLKEGAVEHTLEAAARAWYCILRYSPATFIVESVIFLFDVKHINEPRLLPCDPHQLLLSNWKIFRSPFLRPFLTVLKFVVIGFKHDTLIRYLRKSQPNEAEKQKFGEQILAQVDVSCLIMESSIIQRLVDIAAPTDADDLRTLEHVQSLVYSYINSRFLEDKRLMKLVNYQGYNIHQIEDMVNHVPALDSYIKTIEEQLKSPSYRQKLFAIILGSFLVSKNRSKFSLELCGKMLLDVKNIVTYLQSHPFQVKARFVNTKIKESQADHPFVDDMSVLVVALLNICRTFPTETIAKDVLVPLLDMKTLLLSDYVFPTAEQLCVISALGDSRLPELQNWDGIRHSLLDQIHQVSTIICKHVLELPV